MIPATLPCDSCPHNGACCTVGTFLSREEYSALLAEFGANYVYWDQQRAQYRTRVEDAHCIFWDDGCSIHSHAHYPTVCKLYPQADPRHEGPAHDAAMYPECQ